LGVVLGVLDVVPVVLGVEPVVAPVAAVELLVEEELLLLPHPAMNTLPMMTTTTSHLDRSLNISVPLDRSDKDACPAASQPSAGTASWQRYTRARTPQSALTPPARLRAPS
jgi:hypothetical protein